MKNPLFLHGIVLFIVAACILVAGIIGIVDAMKEVPDSPPATGAPAEGGVIGNLKAADKAQRDATTAQNDAKSLASGGPISAGTALQKAAAAKKLADQMKKLGKFKVLIPAILMIVVALATAACGLFILKEADWARYASFGLVSVTLLYFTYLMSARNAARAPAAEGETGELLNDFNLIWPIGITIIAILAGKFLWDLFVEKFDAQPAAA